MLPVVKAFCLAASTLKIAPLSPALVFPQPPPFATIPPVIATRYRYRASAAGRLRTILASEFSRRKRVNPRYSLRAFARSVALEHSTVSQLLRGKRAVTWKTIRHVATTMRWTGAGILELASQPGYHFNSRRVATQLGISVDEVNIVLADLCMFGLIELKEKTS